MCGGVCVCVCVCGGVCVCVCVEGCGCACVCVCVFDVSFSSYKYIASVLNSGFRIVNKVGSFISWIDR